MDPRRWLDRYKRGSATEEDVANALCQWDRVTDPREFAAEIPEAILALVREQVADIPNVEDVFPIGRLGSPGPVRGSPEYRAEQERCLAGMRLWKAYFDAQATQG